MRLMSLMPHSAAGWGRRFAEVVEQAGLTNAFNPSVARHGSRWHVAFRALRDPHERPFRAYAFSLSDSGDASGLVDLTAHARSFGVSTVADPKTTILDGEVYATFNTGFRADGQNDVHLMRIFPEPGEPQRVVLDERRAVEKNWAFYTTPDGDLRALYELPGLVTLGLVGGRLGSGELTMARIARSDAASALPGLTIGTPLLFAADDAYLIAHQKLALGANRAYLGRPVRVRFAEGVAVEAVPSDVRLIHSVRALWPPKVRHNKHLISATYFAGLAPADDGFLLGYGINDLSAGFARVDGGALWR